MSMMQTDVPEPSHDLRRFWLPPMRALPFTTVGVAPQTLVGGAGLWMGHATEETGGVAGRLIVSDSSGNVTGQTLAPLTFNALQSRLDGLPGNGVVFFNGLTVAATVSTIAGALWAILLTRDELALVLRMRNGTVRR